LDSRRLISHIFFYQLLKKVSGSRLNAKSKGRLSAKKADQKVKIQEIIQEAKK
jgi:hypothetical protein